MPGPTTEEIRRRAIPRRRLIRSGKMGFTTLPNARRLPSRTEIAADGFILMPLRFRELSKDLLKAGPQEWERLRFPV